MDTFINISIVILSYNTKDITKTAIEKAKESVAYCSEKLNNKSEIIVVDNHSTDGSLEMLQKQKGIILITLPENIGCGRGYNAGLKVTKFPYILLMNNDTYLFKETLYNSLRWMDQNKKVDAVIGLTYYADGTLGYPSGSFPTPFKLIRWLLGIESLPIIKDLISPIYHQKVFNKDTKMEWIATCFFFMRREVYDVTKGHDEHMFFYMEDVEWSKRIHDAGFQIWFTPEIRVIHLGGKSSIDQMKMQFLLQNQIDGIIYYQSKHHRKTLRLVKLFLFFGLKMRALAYTLFSNKILATVYNNLTLNTDLSVKQ